MLIDTIISAVIPREKIFFDLFTEAGVNLKSMGIILCDFITEENRDNKESLNNKLEIFEHKNDEVTHRLFLSLGKYFITPFDREDIHDLSSALDDVADFMYAVGRTAYMLEVNTSGSGMATLADAIKNSTHIISDVTADLKRMKNSAGLMKNLGLIYELEKNAARVYDSEITQLFNSESDFKKLLVQRDVYTLMETTLDKCKEVAQVLKQMIVKST